MMLAQRFFSRADVGSYTSLHNLAPQRDRLPKRYQLPRDLLSNPPNQDKLLTYSSDFGAARLDPCELRTVVPYTYTLSELSAELHDTRGCRRRVTCPMGDSLKDRLGIEVTGYRQGSGSFYQPGVEPAGWSRGAMV
ncbi:hypothetical protein EVAR_102126_1 [Eumeta japonica]|uniref:Uncharacterized protein n=1 Tax=Eumeta variegata TaxID=151549 RepID=A0A4C1U055_EUMVA|nr:hypothetical protein EVAR_102126_1 [Eumeta japonica]